MELSSFRQRMLYGQIDTDKKAQVLNELKYFNSIAPASLREKFAGKFNKEKSAEFCNNHKVGVLVGFFLLLPLVIALMAVALQFAVILVLLFVVFGRNRGTPEYKAYDYRNKVAVPAAKVLDEKLDLNFPYN